MKGYTKLILSLLIVVIAIFTLCSCTPDSTDGGMGENSGKAEEYYIKVGDTELNKEYIGYFFYVAQLNMIKEAGMVVGEGGNSTQADVDTFWKTTEIDGRSAVSVARDLAADNAVMQKVQYLKAVEEGITLSTDEEERITVQINNNIQSNGGEVAFDKLLADMGCNTKAYRQILTENKYVEKLYAKYDQSGMLAVTDDELLAYSANHSGEVAPELMLDSAKKDKFNRMVEQWKKEYDIVISDERMKEFQVK